MTLEEIKKQEEMYVMHTYNRFPIALERGKGAVLWDSEGRSYIDMTSGIGVNSLGHQNKALLAAVNGQAEKLLHACNLYYTEPMVRAARSLICSTGMGKVFFANSGAEANEGMIKLARKYSFDKYGEGRSRIITLKQSFHGRTVTTLKATGQDKFHQYFFPFTEGFDYVTPGNIEEMEEKLDDSVCAVMLELIQGEGGVLPLDQEFVKETEKICRKKDILLLIDEVQTGIGRTGTLFCYEQYGISPDVVSAAKGLGGGLPIGAVIASEKCGDVLGAGTHGTTFGGNPLCCAAADTVLSIINTPQFLNSVKEKGRYLKQAILNLGSEQIKEVRGMGLILGIAVEPEKRAGLTAALMEKGVLVLTAGEDTIRLLPPLVITKEEIDRAVEAMKKVF